MAYFREQTQHPENCHDVQNYEQVIDAPTDAILFPSTLQLRQHTRKIQQLSCRGICMSCQFLFSACNQIME